MNITTRELEETIFGEDGNPTPEHNAHMRNGWHDGFSAGYREAKRLTPDWDAHRAAAVNAGLHGLELAGCFACLEFIARKFNRTYET
jgi:hypothetical protein